MTEIKSGTIQAVGTPRRFQGVAKTGPNAGNPYDFTVYKFKLDDGNWYDTRKDPERIVQGAAVQFSYDEEPWERNGKSGINRTVKEFFGDGSPTTQTAPVANDVGGTQTQPPQGGTWTMDNALRIAWNSSVNNAQATLGPITDQWTREQYFALIDDYAHEFYGVILRGPRSPAHETAPQSAPAHIPHNDEPKHLGDLLTIAKARWGMSKAQVADTLKLDLATVVDFGQALAQLEFAQMENVKENV